MIKEIIQEVIQEARDKEVSTEWRIALGKIQRYFGSKTPKKEELDDIAKTVGQKDLKLQGGDLNYFIKWVETKISFEMERGIRL